MVTINLKVELEMSELEVNNSLKGKRIWFDYLGAANHNQSLINAVPLLTGTGDFWLLGFPSGPFRPALCNLIP